ncbi:MAG: ABC transporter substrate-binding protein [Thermoprotei archaeon]
MSNTVNQKIYAVLLSVVLVFSIASFIVNYLMINEVREILLKQELALSKVQANVSGLQEVVSLVSGRTEELGNLVRSLQLRYEELSEELKKVKYPLVISDSIGRTVFINYEPSRVVSVGPSLTETLFALGLGDRVVGVDRFSNYPPVLNELVKEGSVKVVGDAFALNVELIASLKPDVVFLTYSAQIEKYVKTLSDLGVCVYVVKVEDFGDVYNAVMSLGMMMNRVDAALKLLNNITNSVAETYSRVSNYLNSTGTTRVTVYWEVFPDYWTLGGNTFQNSLIVYAGGENIFGNASLAWFMATPESVIDLNPSVILVDYSYGMFGTPQDLIERIASRPGWSNITAVREGKIYVLGGMIEDIVVRPGPRLGLAVEILARILYPGAYNITQVPNYIDENVVSGWGVALSS